MRGGVLRLEARLSVGRQLAISKVFQLLEGGRGDAAEGEEAFLGVDVDLDVMGRGGGGGDVTVPSHVDVAVVPGALEVDCLQVVDLGLQSVEFSRNAVLLLQQMLHAPQLLLISHFKKIHYLHWLTPSTNLSPAIEG